MCFGADATRAQRPSWITRSLFLRALPLPNFSVARNVEKHADIFGRMKVGNANLAGNLRFLCQTLHSRKPNCLEVTAGIHTESDAIRIAAQPSISGRTRQNYNRVEQYRG